MKKTCFMFGHSNAENDIYEGIVRAVKMHYTCCGVRRFVIGHYGNFDKIGRHALAAVKKEYPDIENLLLTPYFPFEKEIQLPEGMDGTLIPEGIENAPKRLRIIRANCAMLKAADTIICHVNHFGNTRDLLEKAEKSKNIEHITNVESIPHP